MSKNNKLEFYVPVILAVIMMIAIKVPYLDKPFCYSESQLLTDSIYYLNFKGLSTVLSGEYVEFPSLFSVLISYFMKYVSTEILFVHLLTSIFSILTIIVIYKFVKFFISKQAGVISATIVIIQNIFLAQTGLILPNMMLNLLIISGLYAYYREKHVLCSIVMSLAVLTDIIGLLTTIYIFIHYYKTSQKSDWKMGKNITLCIPILIWFAYEIASVTICGKLTMNEINFDITNFISNLKFIFIDQFRIVLTGILIASILIIKFSSEIQFYAKDIFKSTSIYFTILFITISIFTNQESYNLILITILGIITGSAISVLNITYYLKYLITSLLICIFAFNTLYEKKYTDAYLSYKDKIEVDKKTIEELKTELKLGNTILCDKYMEMYLKYSKLGYVDGNFECIKNYKIVNKATETNEICNFAIYSDFEPSKSLKQVPNSNDYKCLNNIKKNNYETKIFKYKSEE